MRLADGVEVLEIPSINLQGAPTVIHPTLLWDDDGAVLVDAGYPGQLPRIREAIEKAGVPFGRLRRVIVTHHDLDHVGSLAAIGKERAGVEVLAHEQERPFIQGEQRPIKLTPERVAQREAQIDALPEKQRNVLKAIFATPSRARVDRTLADGERLPLAGGVTVIHTPGHTPGHVCLYLEKSRTLVTGDALNVVSGTLAGPNPQHTHDLDAAQQSLRKLSRYDVETVVCYHGGVYRGDANRRIAELAG